MYHYREFVGKVPDESYNYRRVNFVYYHTDLCEKIIVVQIYFTFLTFRIGHRFSQLGRALPSSHYLRYKSCG